MRRVDAGVCERPLMGQFCVCSFNKTQEDFPDLQTYNNYLEEIEDFSKSDRDRDEMIC